MATIDVQAFDDLDAVAADADGALDRAAQASLFDRLDWSRLTLAHAPPPGRLLVVRAAADGARAWLFLMVEHGAAVALASWYSLRVGFAHAGSDQPRSTDCMTAIARHLRASGIATLSLSPLAHDADAARRAFREAGWRAVLTEASANWSAEVTDWASYWSRRPTRLRETVRRRGRDGRLRFVVFDRFDAPAWDDYEQVYVRSWKPVEGAPAFLRVLAEQEGAAGTLRLGLAYDDDRPVAAQLWLVEGGVATIHKLAHDASHLAGSPGTLLTHAMFRNAIAIDGVRQIDFGTGDDAYKADWMDERRPLYRLEAWNLARPLGLAGWLRQLAGNLVHRRRNR